MIAFERKVTNIVINPITQEVYVPLVNREVNSPRVVWQMLQDLLSSLTTVAVLLKYRAFFCHRQQHDIYVTLWLLRQNAPNDRMFSLLIIPSIKWPRIMSC